MLTTKQAIFSPMVVMHNGSYRYEWQLESRSTKGAFGWTTGNTDLIENLQDSKLFKRVISFLEYNSATKLTTLVRADVSDDYWLIHCDLTILKDTKGRPTRSIRVFALENIDIYVVIWILQQLSGENPIATHEDDLIPGLNISGYEIQQKITNSLGQINDFGEPSYELDSVISSQLFRIFVTNIFSNGNCKLFMYDRAQTKVDSLTFLKNLIALVPSSYLGTFALIKNTNETSITDILEVDFCIYDSTRPINIIYQQDCYQEKQKSELGLYYYYTITYMVNSYEYTHIVETIISFRQKSDRDLLQNLKVLVDREFNSIHNKVQNELHQFEKDKYPSDNQTNTNSSEQNADKSWSQILMRRRRDVIVWSLVGIVTILTIIVAVSMFYSQRINGIENVTNIYIARVTQQAQLLQAFYNLATEESLQNASQFQTAEAVQINEINSLRATADSQYLNNLSLVQTVTAPTQQPPQVPTIDSETLFLQRFSSPCTLRPLSDRVLTFNVPFTENPPEVYRVGSIFESREPFIIASSRNVINQGENLFPLWWYVRDVSIDHFPLSTSFEGWLNSANSYVSGDCRNIMSVGFELNGGSNNYIMSEMTPFYLQNDDFLRIFGSTSFRFLTTAENQTVQIECSRNCASISEIKINSMDLSLDEIRFNVNESRSIATVGTFDIEVILVENQPPATIQFLLQLQNE